jgi:hypothetical protein
MTIWATYIITNGLKTASVAKLAAKDAQGNPLHPGLQGMFTTPLGSSGSTTHWISSGWMSEEEIAFLDSQLPVAFHKSTGKFIDEQGEHIEDGHGAMARFGLRMIQEEE